MQKNGDSWAICKDEHCFKGQGGTIDPPKSGNRFTSSKFSISKASEIFNIALSFTESYKKTHPNLSEETEAQFVESIFKTISGSYKE